MNRNKVGTFFNMLEFGGTGNKISEAFTNILIFAESSIQINNASDTV
jgi:hypothetical protein